MESDLNKAAPAAAAPPGAGGGQVAAGTVFGGRFRVQSFLRREAATEVYRAVDTAADAPVGLRVVQLSTLGPAATQLEADVENARALVHKNLVIIIEVGHQDDLAYIASEMVDGQTLRELIDAKRAEGRSMTPKGAYNVVAHVANALAEVHKAAVHGGLNPANIWVNKAGRVKVGDLGLIRAIPMLARRGGPPGAPDNLYLAPEVSAGAPSTAASDVYALGAILYELLTGRAPVVPLRPPSQVSGDLSPAVDGVIARALKKAPEARFSSVDDLKQALGAAMAAPVAAAPAAVAAPSPQAVPPGASAELAVEMGNAAQAPGLPVPAGRPSIGRMFNVAEAAAGVTDDQQERWLIQKDKLDFGPFSMTQVKAQIERGDIVGDHMIVDMDSGARKKVKDHPLLKEFTKAAQRKLEQVRRAQAERVSETREKKKSAATVFIVGAAVLVVGLGVGAYIYLRPAAVDEKLAVRVGEADIDEFLKNVKFNFASVSVAKRGARRGGGSGGPADEFNNDQNLGDVSAGGGGDETLDDSAIQRVMMGNYRSLVPCIMEERRRSSGLSTVNLEFVVRGTGKVSAVKANGQRGGPFASCLLGKMQSFNFPKFNGGKTIAGWSMSMR